MLHLNRFSAFWGSIKKISVGVDFSLQKLSLRDFASDKAEVLCMSSLPCAITQAASTIATTLPCATVRLVGTSTVTLECPLFVKTKWHPMRAMCCSTY